MSIHLRVETWLDLTCTKLLLENNNVQSNNDKIGKVYVKKQLKQVIV